MKTSDLLIASGLFSSKGDMLRAVKGKGVKINRILVDINELDDLIGNDDLLSGIFIPHGIELIRKKVLVVQRGKAGAFVQLVDEGPRLINEMMLFSDEPIAKPNCQDNMPVWQL